MSCEHGRDRGNELDGRSDENTNILKCQACAYVSCVQTEIEDHILNEHSFMCQMCSLVCTSQEFLNGHIQTHKEKENYQCTLCNFVAKDQGTLDVHTVCTHQMMTILQNIDRNQSIMNNKYEDLNKTYEEFKSKMVNALNKMLEENHSLKQEMFIMRQSIEVSKNDDTSKAVSPPVSNIPVDEPSVAMVEESIENILVVGDSIATNLHTDTIEIATKAKVRTAKAYSSANTNGKDKIKKAPRFPTKNFNDVLKNEVKNQKDDVLIVQAGSTDITNLKAETWDEHNVDEFKEETVKSARNLFSAVMNAAACHPRLKKIIIMKQIPRYDFLTSNPPGLKHLLSDLYNETLDKLYDECEYKDRVIMGDHDLECAGGVLQARYKDSLANRFDGVHMYGPSGKKAYTESVMKILNSAQLVKTTPPKYYEEFYHKNCRQTRYQSKQKSQFQAHKQNQNTNFQSKTKTKTRPEQAYQYVIPTRNRFTTLGDYFPKNY